MRLQPTLSNKHLTSGGSINIVLRFHPLMEPALCVGFIFNISQRENTT